MKLASASDPLQSEARDATSTPAITPQVSHGPSTATDLLSRLARSIGLAPTGIKSGSEKIIKQITEDGSSDEDAPSEGTY